MFTTTWSQKLLCSCKGHQNGTWHHGFVTIINVTTCLIFGYIYNLKIKNKKYHLLLQPIATNNNSISNDDDVACHVLTRCYN
jgi:hypothetical protein